MFVKVIRIHFVNGEVLPIAECTEDEGESKILERYRKALPDGLSSIDSSLRIRATCLSESAFLVMDLNCNFMGDIFSQLAKDERIRLT